ncbi:hypothetical protein ABPG75_012790 [Micractinium tetrahymenae]
MLGEPVTWGLASGKLARGLLVCKALWAACRPMLRSAARVEAPSAAATAMLLEHKGTIAHLELGASCTDFRDCAALLASLDAARLRSLALTAHLDMRLRTPAQPYADDEELHRISASTLNALAPATRLQALSLVVPWDSDTAALLANTKSLSHLSLHIPYMTTDKAVALAVALRALPRLSELHLVLSNIQLLFDPDSDGASWINNGVWDFVCTPPLAGLPLRVLAIQGAVGLPPDWRQLSGLRQLRVVSSPECGEWADEPEHRFSWGSEPAPGLTALTRLEVKGIMPAVEVAASLPALRVLRDIRGRQPAFEAALAAARPFVQIIAE